MPCLPPSLQPQRASRVAPNRTKCRLRISGVTDFGFGTLERFLCDWKSGNALALCFVEQLHASARSAHPRSALERNRIRGFFHGQSAFRWRTDTNRLDL